MILSNAIDNKLYKLAAIILRQVVSKYLKEINNPGLYSLV